MLFEEKETNLLDDLRLVVPQEIFLVNDDKETVEVFNSIYENLSGKSGQMHHPRMLHHQIFITIHST